MPKVDTTLAHTTSRLAVVDVGSNSFNLLIVDSQTSPLIKLAHEKCIVQLARGRSETGHLTEEAIDRGLDCLRQFSLVLSKFHPLHLQVVGTEALRSAPNAEDFLTPAESILGHAVQLISPREEARLAYRGVRLMDTTGDAGLLVIDIGGASTEITYGEGDEVKFWHSFPLGCVTLADRHFNFNDPSSISLQLDNTHSCYRECLDTIAPLKSELPDTLNMATGAAGIMRVIKDLHLESPRLLTSPILQTMVGRMINDHNYPDPEKVSVARPVLASGLIILSAVLSSLELKGLRVSDGNIKYGLLADHLQR